MRVSAGEPATERESPRLAMLLTKATAAPREGEAESRCTAGDVIHLARHRDARTRVRHCDKPRVGSEQYLPARPAAGGARAFPPGAGCPGTRRRQGVGQVLGRHVIATAMGAEALSVRGTLDHWEHGHRGRDRGKLGT